MQDVCPNNNRIKYLYPISYTLNRSRGLKLKQKGRQPEPQFFTFFA